MINCDSTCWTVSIATPTRISSDVPPKMNVIPRPSVMNRGSAASSQSPMNGMGSTRNPLVRNVGRIATSDR